jgi:hypothetical protein
MVVVVVADPEMLEVPIGTSESEDDIGSTSASSLRLSRRERLIYSSSAELDSPVTEKAGIRRVGIDDARMGG